MQRRTKIILASITACLALAAAAGGWLAMSSGMLEQKKSPPPRAEKAMQKPPAPAESKRLRENPAPAKVDPVTEFRPSTVYSGTLGELTGIQAGRELAKANFELRSQELKLRELEDKLGKSSGPALPAVPAAKAEKPAARERFYVSAVRGSGRSLTAVIRSSRGTSYHVSVGDVIPGHGKITSIRKDSVEVSGVPLAWM